MKINLSNLNYKERIDINEVFNYPENYLEKSNIKKLDNIKVEGYLSQNDMNEYMAYLTVRGKMIILDSITLEQIPYNFEFVIDDIIPSSCVNEQNMLDIMELLWQNIVLEVPIRYTQSDADNLKGDNWEVLSDNNEEEKIDPRMQKLYEYYNEGGE